MDVTRKGIISFAAAIAVTLLIRSVSVSFSSPSADNIVVYGGILLGVGFWILGVYYGYVSMRM